MRALLYLGLLLTTGEATARAADAISSPASTSGQTRVSIVDGKWHINGKLTYPGTKAEGLLRVRPPFRTALPREFP